MKEEILEAINDERLYDYIANNYYKMSKEELKTVLLNVIYVYVNDNLSLKDELYNETKESLY